METAGTRSNYESGAHERHQDRKHHLTGVFTIKELARSLKANIQMEKRVKDKALNYFNPCRWTKRGGPCKTEKKNQEYVGFQ